MEAPRRFADPQRDGAVFVYDLAVPPTAPSLPGVELRAATPDDMPRVRAAMHASGEYPDDVVRARLGDDRHPYVAVTAGLIASYGWVAFSTEPVGDLGLSFRMAPDAAYIYDCATRPDYRGRGYYPALLRYMLADLRRLGRRHAWIGTAPGNFVSQRGIARAGFAKVADVDFVRRPDGSFHVDLYGVPGVSPTLLDQAAWAFHGRAYPDAGIPISTR